MGLAAAGLIAVFSKESGVIIVAVVFLYDVAFCRQRPLGARLPGYFAAALPCMLFLLVR